MRNRRAEESSPAGPRWTRRSVLRVLAGLGLLATGLTLLKRTLLRPRLFTPSQRETLAVVLTTLLPDGEFAGRRRTQLLERVLPLLQADTTTQRGLAAGLEFLEAQAGAHGAHSFAALGPEQRATILTACADAADGTPEHFLYRTVRDRAMRVHYADPSTWGPLRFAHPPQPRGYPDYWTAPRA